MNLIRQKLVKDQVLYRELAIDAQGINTETRTVPASLSSEIEVPRWFGQEMLVHEPGAVDLSRAADGLPLLFQHDQKMPIGLAENVRIDGDRLRADLRFSKNDLASQVWQDINEGFLRNISIGYSVQEIEERGETARVTRWRIHEASVVTVPIDPTVGINRAAEEGNVMTENTETRGNQDAGQGGGVDIIQLSDVARRKEQERGAEQERLRQRSINDLFGQFMGYDGAEDVRNDCINADRSVDEARKELLRFLGGRSQPIASPMSDQRRMETATPGEDAQDKWVKGVTEALEVRFCIEEDAKKRKNIRAENEYTSMSLMELSRDYLRRTGHNMKGLSAVQIAGMALKRSGIISTSSSDFTDILANVGNKSVLLGFEQAPETWRPFCRIGSIPDYKQAARVGTTSFSDLDRVYENGEYKHGTTGDIRENITMRKYGKLWTISREAILNDDQDLFNRMPRLLGAAAARVVGDIVYTEILIGNPSLNQDSTDLFHADHSNLVAAGSGAVPSAATLNTAYAAMGTQTDPDANATLNVTPQFLIVPKALEATALNLTTALYQDTAPGVTSGVTITGSNNRFSGLEVIAEPRIDADDAAKWFLSANPSQFDTIEVAFLNGQESPYMEQEQGLNQDGVTYKVRLEVTGAAMGYVGLYHNDGN